MRTHCGCGLTLPWRGRGCCTPGPSAEFCWPGHLHVSQGMFCRCQGTNLRVIIRHWGALACAPGISGGALASCLEFQGGP